MKLLVAVDYCPQDRISTFLENGDFSFLNSTKIGFTLSENKGLQYRDFIDCESHRDKLLYFLRSTYK